MGDELTGLVGASELDGLTLVCLFEEEVGCVELGAELWAQGMYCHHHGPLPAAATVKTTDARMPHLNSDDIAMDQVWGGSAFTGRGEQLYRVAVRPTAAVFRAVHRLADVESQLSRPGSQLPQAFRPVCAVDD